MGRKRRPRRPDPSAAAAAVLYFPPAAPTLNMPRELERVEKYFRELVLMPPPASREEFKAAVLKLAWAIFQPAADAPPPEPWGDKKIVPPRAEWAAATARISDTRSTAKHGATRTGKRDGHRKRKSENEGLAERRAELENERLGIRDDRARREETGEGPRLLENLMPTEKSIERLAQAAVEPMLGGISIAGLAYLRAHPECEAMNRVSFPCSKGCGAWIEGPYFFAAVTACDACRAAREKADKLDQAKTYWEALCPQSFRETKKDHPGFPRAQYAATRAWPKTRELLVDDVPTTPRRFVLDDESLFFYGPSGKGKSRLGMWLLKRCLVRFEAARWRHVAGATEGGEERARYARMDQHWGKYDLLLMDDALAATASDGRIAEAFKDLLDYRLRFNRRNIVTSQIEESDVEQQFDKFGKSTKADKEMIKALWRRLRESSRVVSFADAVPTTGQEAF